MKALQSIKSLKSKKDRELYIETLNAIYDELDNLNKSRSFAIDNKRQHKTRINQIIIKGKVNPQIKQWLMNNSKSDIVGIDDIPKDVIKRLKYGKDYLSKSDRKILSMVRKINNKRNEKILMKDLSGNEKILPLREYKKWLNNKSKYDIKGVDTIPEAVAGKTASAIAKKYKTTSKKKKYTRLTDTKRGLFSHPKNFEEEKKRRFIRINRIIKGTKQSQITLAHEIGHSFDLLKNKFKKPSNQIINEMKKLATKLNPTPISFKEWDKLKDTKEFREVSPALKSYMKYREKPAELFADSFAYLVYNPPKVKKDYKMFYNYVIRKTPKLKKIFEKERKAVIKKIVKTIKKDKKFLEQERIKKMISKKRDELKKLKSRKRIGPKTKQKIRNIEKSINEYRQKLK